MMRGLVSTFTPSSSDSSSDSWKRSGPPASRGPHGRHASPAKKSGESRGSRGGLEGVHTDVTRRPRRNRGRAG
eukprot:949448-Prorocentrum_minimum.AAC.1